MRKIIKKIAARRYEHREIIESLDEATYDQIIEALEAEKTTLTARLAEIDNHLAQYRQIHGLRVGEEIEVDV